MLSKVVLSSEVWFACQSHALTSNSEEIMGLLIGDVTDDGDSITLTAMRIGRRMTKQKDRVEIDDAVSIEASEYAESMGKRVLGWYHSHPRITVHPSHLDLVTQANYQQMEPNFVGLIFSVFDYDKERNIDTRQTIAFQTHLGECRYIRLEVEDTRFTSSDSLEKGFGFDALSRLPDILKEEEIQDCQSREASDPLTQLQNRGCLVSQLSSQTQHVTAPILESMAARKHYLVNLITSLKLKEQELQK